MYKPRSLQLNSNFPWYSPTFNGRYSKLKAPWNYTQISNQSQFTLLSTKWTTNHPLKRSYKLIHTTITFCIINKFFLYPNPCLQIHPVTLPPLLYPPRTALALRTGWASWPRSHCTPPQTWPDRGVGFPAWWCAVRSVGLVWSDSLY